MAGPQVCMYSQPSAGTCGAPSFGGGAAAPPDSGPFPLLLFRLALRVVALARRDERDVHGLPGEDRALAGELGDGGLEEVLVVALGEVGLVVGAARLVAVQSPERDDAR